MVAAEALNATVEVEPDESKSHPETSQSVVEDTGETEVVKEDTVGSVETEVPTLTEVETVKAAEVKAAKG